MGNGLVTRIAIQDAAGLGYGSTEITTIIQTITKGHFYKSMTSNYNASRRSKMSKAPVCPETGKAMVRDTRPMDISYKGQSTTIDMPGWYCHESGESIFTAEDMKVSDAALKELRKEVENLLKPQDVKRIRTKIGLTQREAGTLLGGGPNAFQKYEQDTVSVSKPMSNLLRILERHPEEVEELKKQA
jgi:HTH-type transcriptional regulator/antitoxin MqsA